MDEEEHIKKKYEQDHRKDHEEMSEGIQTYEFLFHLVL